MELGMELMYVMYSMYVMHVMWCNAMECFAMLCNVNMYAMHACIHKHRAFPVTSSS